jgi:hypothetical protein
MDALTRGLAVASRCARLVEDAFDIVYDVLDTPIGWGLMGGWCTFVFLKLALGV